MPSFQGRLVFVEANISMNAMIDEIFGVKLFGQFESSFAEELLECTLRECFVLLLQ
jgi:hypothetical protein